MLYDMLRKQMCNTPADRATVHDASNHQVLLQILAENNPYNRPLKLVATTVVKHRITAY
jgi:hypothetical protein